MISKDQIINETYNGTIGKSLSEIVKIPTFTSIKKSLVEELIETCADNGYLVFNGYTHHMVIGRVGQSFLYNLPETTRGRLKVFAGSQVRVICVGSGQRWNRIYAVGPA